MNIASSTTGSISQRREPGGDTVSVTTLPQQFGVFLMATSAGPGIRPATADKIGQHGRIQPCRSCP
jgi:hypothetical protein